MLTQYVAKGGVSNRVLEPLHAHGGSVQFASRYRLEAAMVNNPPQTRYVVIDERDQLHRAASDWLTYLHNIQRSPNTVRNYGIRVARYLSWTAQTADWRSIRMAHLALWKNTVASTPVKKSNGQEFFRSEETVGRWMTPVRSFYQWCDAHGLLTTDVVSRMTELKYFAPGTAAGGEFGTTRRVLVSELSAPTTRGPAANPEWINDASARERLELLDLNLRDRFLVDLLYFTGLRVGEALSLFSADMHFGGGSPGLGCRLVDPHLHVVMDNPVQNEARAKGAERPIFASDHLVERYVDYVLERQAVLGHQDDCPHVFVNLYTPGKRRGMAMTYSGVKGLMDRISKRIDFNVTGPHMLRHTLATRLIRGIDCEPQPTDVVGVLLGHRSEASIRVYTHDSEAAQKRALAAIRPRVLLLER